MAEPNEQRRMTHHDPQDRIMKAALIAFAFALVALAIFIR